MTGLKVTKQQFVDAMFQRFKRCYQPAPDYYTQKKVREGAAMDFDRINLEGFVLVDREALETRIVNLENEMNKIRVNIKGDAWFPNAVEPATYVRYLQGRKDALEKEVWEAKP